MSCFIFFRFVSCRVSLFLLRVSFRFVFRFVSLCFRFVSRFVVWYWYVSFRFVLPCAPFRVLSGLCFCFATRLPAPCPPQVYVQLLRCIQPEVKELVHAALDILVPALPFRLTTTVSLSSFYSCTFFAGLFTGRDPTRRVGQKGLEILRIESDRFTRCSEYHGSDPTRPDPTRPNIDTLVRSDPRGLPRSGKSPVFMFVQTDWAIGCWLSCLHLIHMVLVAS